MTMTQAIDVKNEIADIISNSSPSFTSEIAEKIVKYLEANFDIKQK